MKKILSILLSGMIAASLLIGCSSATTEDNSAANEHQITETVEYTSLKKDETHAFDEELIKDDGTYTLKDVTYDNKSNRRGRKHNPKWICHITACCGKQ